ncbi:sirohydrochlorin cobaltochelatase [Suipraeoptans intestinalis]|uniref:sirohydrochlorin cobaltochelatase n=1 Tax=Suipraeoptans intestinalis TaxID=2606628 RepID=UPI001F1B17A2|nr:sirohydrochlorin cobaltochelatase [Suipraeoptans intestinalis]MDD7769653.1 sirohydrochlorin cobaltochelatase [Suipraeoptans intestinalis]MDY3121269.1 sirohydrochlorin cobaltochelatase [Suipraeoptans intestinalis]
MNHTSAILVVSFGTSYPDTRKRTIQAIEEKIQKTFPHFPLYRAWTSHMIRQKLLHTTGEHIPSVTEAMEQMRQDGISHVYIQPTHILNGVENDQMKEDALMFASVFSSISFGAPLLTSQGDLEEMAVILKHTFPTLAPHEALVFMGHGSVHFSNAAYAALNFILEEKGFDGIYVGTVEAYPKLAHILPRLKASSTTHIHLFPLMVVAGDHATNDMASDDPDSWKSILQTEGFDVTCHLTGLGELFPVQNLFLAHLREILPENA